MYLVLWVSDLVFRVFLVKLLFWVFDWSIGLVGLNVLWDFGFLVVFLFIIKEMFNL